MKTLIRCGLSFGLIGWLFGCPQQQLASSTSAGTTTNTTSNTTSISTSTSSGPGTTGTSATTSTNTNGTIGTNGTVGTIGTVGTVGTTTSTTSGSTGTPSIQWASMGTPVSNLPVYSVYGTSVSDVYAGTLDGFLLHFNGSGWSQVTQLSGDVVALWAAPSGAVFGLYGMQPSYAFSCSGNCSSQGPSYTDVSTTSTGCIPVGICGGSGHVYLVGDDNQNNGCLIANLGEGSQSVFSLGSDNADTCWVDNSDGSVYISAHAAIFRYQPLLASVAPETINWPSGWSGSTSQIYFHAPWGNGTSTFISAMGRRIFARDSSSGSWSLVLGSQTLAAGEPNPFNVLTGGGSEAFALGPSDDNGQQVAHWDGNSWSYAPEIASSVNFFDAWAAGPNDYFAVGSDSSNDTVILRGHRQ